MQSSVLPSTSQQYWIDPANTSNYTSPNSRQILRIATNLKYLIDEVIPITYEENIVTCEHSRILNAKVIKLARAACGGDRKDRASVRKYESVIVFALLKVCGWYWGLAESELHNSELYNMRAVTAQQLSKLIIEETEFEDHHYTFMQLLLRRYVINENDCDSSPISALELAMDMHCTIVIGSSGYQRCLKWLWRGWIVQNKLNPETYILSPVVPSCEVSKHFTPERLRAPIYQNLLQIIFSLLYLVLFTVVVNQKDSVNVQPIGFWESLFYVFTLGHALDELVKCYHVGWAYIGFWNVYHDFMFSIIICSIVIRIISVCPWKADLPSEHWDIVSYRILACAAPLVWSRLLLYLESERFVGALLVVLAHMMRESIYFFSLLILIMIGFLQGFLGLDSADGRREITWPILSNLFTTILGDGGFDMFERFAPPYAAILYYSYCFIVTIILLNILIALYSSAYQKVIDNVTDEYLALMAQKTLRYIRAPDEDVYVPPLNLIEICITPIIWMLPKTQGKYLSSFVMTLIYSPLLCYISIFETIQARRIVYNRLNKLPDDANENDVAWDLTDGFLEEEANILDSDFENSYRMTQKKNERALLAQREAEEVDPRFPVDKGWFSEVKTVVQPVSEGYETGIGWESYKIFKELNDQQQKAEEKIETLTTTINQLTELIKEMKIKND
ncbi:Yvc1p [Kluyveromyces lactis]|uniref:KLLA0C13772p n=1 Tax=Kluyveromyces lactis (strain ATCC 8585 / CBS 2359 / DSM 70799 / NBRC 1267 / NRRL Y-1140 / WM37) TaxID=284590 RepID=Q6CTC4_KLULA|nr:uncharacterized protein KLLA0_C13772g [Kluyveromyces lactis]CAH01666.1 KLLA0C13772p [Kluyveromyces lactis]|eukprot:XP_452815.1 uncharacterized protein KLLA0_C13772g [Kluyveromyces lactis]